MLWRNEWLLPASPPRVRMSQRLTVLAGSLPDAEEEPSIVICCGAASRAASRLTPTSGSDLSAFLPVLSLRDAPDAG